MTNRGDPRRRTLTRPLARLALALALAPGVEAAAPALPPTPAPIASLVAARPFVLDEPFRFPWEARPESVGLLIVVEADPGLLYPRQSPTPVLYVDGRAAAPASAGWESGRLLAVVPGVRELAGARVWFGTPELLERVTPARGREELALAVEAGIEPLAAWQAEAALRAAAGEPPSPLAAASFAELGAEIAALRERFASPD